jgi:hypothetical protein
MTTLRDILILIAVTPLVLGLFLIGGLWILVFFALCLLASALGWLLGSPARISRKRCVANGRFGKSA